MPLKPTLLHFKDAQLQQGGPSLNWKIRPGELWLVRGNSEESKSLLSEIFKVRKQLFAGEIFYSPDAQASKGLESFRKQIYYVDFLHPSSKLPEAFYQQRYHSGESESGPTLAEYLGLGTNMKHALLPGRDGESNVPAGPQPSLAHLLSLFNLHSRLYEPIIRLSTGEFRKLAILAGLLKNPSILILFEPFAGLDQESVNLLGSILNNLTSTGISTLLFSENSHPDWTSIHYLFLDKSRFYFAVDQPEQKEIFKLDLDEHELLNALNDNFEIAFELENITVKDGSRKLLDGINWKVKKGEKWALTGRNGAGKSMLLSLIFADHPQAYSNIIYLFGKKRGTGESIWEIREKIAYFSSELFMYASKNKTCKEIAYSMIRSNPYKFHPVSAIEDDFFKYLMNLFNLYSFIDTPLHSLPQKTQRLVYLISCFLKNAPLIILDEPFHGFDTHLIEKLKAFLNSYCQDRTLVLVTHRKSEIPSIIQQELHLLNGKVVFNSL